MSPATGEIRSGRCGATTLDVCPGDARLYFEDAKVIIRSGIIQHLEAGDQISLITLTPPGLWRADAPEERRKTHRFYPRYWELARSHKPVSRNRLRREASRAVCGPCTEEARANRPPGTLVSKVPAVRHPPEDPLAGLPVHLDAFDYEAAALWNWRLSGDSGLWHRTTTYLQRRHGDHIKFVKALEWSRRGVPHAHILINAALTHQQVAELVAAVNASLRAGRQGWGEILDVQQLTIKGEPDGSINVGRTTSYLAKYLTKTSGGGLLAAASDNQHASTHLTRLQWAARDVAASLANIRPGGPCPEEDCNGILLEDRFTGMLTCSRRQPIVGPTCLWEGRDRIDRYTRNLGLRAHRFSKSHNWAIEHRESRTRPGTFLPVVNKAGKPCQLGFTVLRHRRHQWQQRHNPDRAPPGPWIWIGTPRPAASSAAPNAPPTTKVA
ncbi:MAG: replication initiator [Acidimicrobiia bacterium]